MRSSKKHFEALYNEIVDNFDTCDDRSYDLGHIWPFSPKMPLPEINSTFTPAEVLSGITDRVRKVRRENKLSQKEFAEACAIPERTYKRIEAGECDSLVNLVKIICYLDRQASFNLFFLQSDLPNVPRTAPQKAVQLEKKMAASKK